MQRGFYRELIRHTHSDALRHTILLRSTNSRRSATLKAGSARIAYPNLDDSFVSCCGLRDWEVTRGWTARLTMTEEDRKKVLNELSKSRFLQNAARKAGFAATDVEDAAQDALEKLARMALDDYARILNIKFYAARIIRNQAVEMASNRKSIPPHIDIADPEHETLTQESFPEPYKSYDFEQMSQSVQEALDGLEPLEGAVAQALINDESGPVLARRFKLTIDVIRGARERLRKKLSKFLDGWRD